MPCSLAHTYQCFTVTCWFHLQYWKVELRCRLQVCWCLPVLRFLQQYSWVFWSLEKWHSVTFQWCLLMGLHGITSQETWHSVTFQWYLLTRMQASHLRGHDTVSHSSGTYWLECMASHLRRYDTVSQSSGTNWLDCMTLHLRGQQSW
jgi:hypothetical protein